MPAFSPVELPFPSQTLLIDLTKLRIYNLSLLEASAHLLHPWRTVIPSRSPPSPPGKSSIFGERRSQLTAIGSGKLVQIEYALNAVNTGVTALGIKATNGVVLATEKKSSSPLVDPPSLSKVSLITPDIGMVYAGMSPDYRVLVDKARKVSHTGYKRIYNEYPPTRILVQDVARVVQEATQSGGVRPYGVSLLIAGWDEGVEPEAEEKTEEGTEKKVSGKTGGILKGGPSLYQVDPSGSYFPWKATAIGKSATSAKTFLEKRYTEGLELEDAIHIALLTLKETIEGEMNGETVEIGIVGPPADHLLGYQGVDGARGPRFRKLTKEEIEDYLTNL
ncbi:20S proteasome subunit alpha 2 [Talaromyces islandicus]|uniref:20S proteasome subunit alpha 2 n=1 Tax=Talaromyces islandicus TaxID=28573 RepID=A0A0U1M1V4_TALIS|nr:20S proteasome subunit alpha 2 [Talaromyces islandicus]